MLAIAPLPEYDEDNENQYREDIRRRLDRTWKKNANVIIPFGYQLGFTGQDGSEAAFKYDAGTLSIVINGTTVVSFATDAAITALQDAFEAADTVLQANITSEAITRAGADGALAIRTTALEATIDTPSTGLSARVTLVESVAAGNTGAIATVSAELVAARDGEVSLIAKITSIDQAIVDGDTAVASTVTTLTATVGGKNQTFVQTSAPTAISIGDLWIDSDDNNKLYRATAPGTGSWVAVPYSDTGKVTTFAQTSAPSAIAVGDLWIDTDDNNKVYRATATGTGSWSAVDDARISINATAIATVDGKLTASYGIVVDGGGRIASLKLLSNGTTSTIAFTSTTFLVYNGTTDEAPFEISGGVVKIKTANVGDLNATTITAGTLNVARIGDGTLDTIKMAINAVTKGAVSETDTGYTVTTSYGDIGSITPIVVPDSDTLVKLDWSFFLDGVNADLSAESVVYVEITREPSGGGSATQIYETFAGGSAAMLHYELSGGVDELDIPYYYLGQVAGFDSDQPGAGSYTYRLRLKKVGGSGTWEASKRRFFGMIFKR